MAHAGGATSPQVHADKPEPAPAPPINTPSDHELVILKEEGAPMGLVWAKDTGRLADVKQDSWGDLSGARVWLHRRLLAVSIATPSGLQKLASGTAEALQALKGPEVKGAAEVRLTFAPVNALNVHMVPAAPTGVASRARSASVDGDTTDDDMSEAAPMTMVEVKKPNLGISAPGSLGFRKYEGCLPHLQAAARLMEVPFEGLEAEELALELARIASPLSPICSAMVRMRQGDVAVVCQEVRITVAVKRTWVIASCVASALCTVAVGTSWVQDVQAVALALINAKASATSTMPTQVVRPPLRPLRAGAKAQKLHHTVTNAVQEFAKAYNPDYNDQEKEMMQRQDDFQTSVTPSLHKTALCRFHEEGFCKWGDNCMWAHGEEELRTPDPELVAEHGSLPQQAVRAVTWKTELCRYFAEGRCRQGEGCQWAHGAHELRPKPPSTIAPIMETSADDPYDDTQYAEDDAVDEMAAEMGLGESANPGNMYTSLLAMQREDVATQSGGVLGEMGDVVGRTTHEMIVRPADGGELKVLSTTVNLEDPHAAALIDEIDPATGEYTLRAQELRKQMGEQSVIEGKDFKVIRERLDERMGFDFAKDMTLKGVKRGSAAAKAGMDEDYFGWKLVKINGAEVRKLSDCAGHVDEYSMTLTLIPPPLGQRRPARSRDRQRSPDMADEDGGKITVPHVPKFNPDLTCEACGLRGHEAKYCMKSGVRERERDRDRRRSPEEKDKDRDRERSGDRRRRRDDDEDRDRDRDRERRRRRDEEGGDRDKDEDGGRRRRRRDDDDEGGDRRRRRDDDDGDRDRDRDRDRRRRRSS
eukprot:TRINITY_DN13720_c2_g1_i1.p2 TRINITY_DN13720_c2_g1~~TRINITY_DN13720_c2_g1_i1.p2  ORF type:complete len:849 (+),score=345.67 TRINITY_DN13720_c2_g1_i1:103-2547(+)